MAETNATILIPDISGFTEFITTTELNHSSKAIHMLIDAILNAVGEEYEISEIEGDAVLMIKKGPAPSQKEIRKPESESLLCTGLITRSISKWQG